MTVLLLALVLCTAVRAAEPSEAWWSHVQRDIAASEYELTWQPESQAFTAPNRAHGFRATFAGPGLRVVPRQVADGETSWEWGLAFIGWGRPSDTRAVGAATPVASGPRVEYVRGPILEWYVNTPRGLEQGFTLNAPPAEAGTQVDLDFALTGTLFPVFSEDGQAIDFATLQGRKVLRYAELVVTDARGQVLQAWMEGIPGGIRLAFADADAVYPVTVDPLATSPSWTNAGSGEYGFAVETAGDVNADGYSDIAVSALQFVNGGTAGSGRVYVYHGSASGPSLVASSVLVNPLTGNATRLGWDVGTAGDVNGDGYSDLLVTIQSDQPGVNSHASLYPGSASGTLTSHAWMVDTGDNYSYAAAAGDVNGDGYADVIVGCPADAPEARAFLGSPSGLPTTPSWSVTGVAGDALGISVGTAGDVNGDGYSDVVVGASQASNGTSFSGRAYAYYGSGSGLAITPSWTVAGTQASESFGRSVGTAGDVNGDGYADVIVGAPSHGNGQTQEGRAFVYLGSVSGLATTALWFAESNQLGAFYGDPVATAGDLNGDGYADVVVGAPWYDAPSMQQGRAYVYFGSAFGLIPVAGWTADGPQAQAFYARAVGTAGDVNGDGYADVIVGSQANFAHVFLGSASGLDTNPGWNRESDQGGAWFGLSVAGAGDVDGDGYADILVGAPNYDGGDVNEGLALLFRGSPLGTEVSASWTAESNQVGAQLGFSVAPAGDVNGDGFADAVIGAPGWSNGETGEGRASIYLGSPTGLAANAAWNVESNSASAAYGRVVASAGDVNGDGYGEVLVGAPYFDHELTDEGKANLYLGSATGPATTPAWTVEGNQMTAGLGWSLGTAGDTNRDGFADVIVGAPGANNGQSNEGRAFLYLGSDAGLATTAAWTAESDQVNAFLGRSVSTAGDVNGDGHADAIVGADSYSNGHAAEGRVWMYLGGVSGLAILPVWMAESDQAGAHFGFTASTAGDVNGDGFADVIVGAPDYDGLEGSNAGKAYVFHGNVNGLSLVPLWTVEGHGTSSFLGAAVAAAGDVNGDGYGDVVVGEPFDDDGEIEIDEGRAIIYRGGFRGGTPMRPRQRRVATGGPVQRFGTSDSPDAVRLDLLARSPFGRGKVRLEWEVKPLGTSFNGMATGLAAGFVDSGVAGAMLDQLIAGLSPATQFHWRVRVRYHPATTPFAQSSRWVTVPWGGWNEAMVRTGSGGPVPAGNVAALSLAKAIGGQVQLSWGASCAATDTDYEVYEGTLGTFSSHQQRTCSTAGATTTTLTPLGGNRYFLVVPRNADREGSYGSMSDGVERPVNPPTCVTKELAGCNR